MSKDIVTNDQPKEIASSDSFMTMIERVALNPEVDVEKMSAILDMQERVLKRNAEISFNAAMSACQSEMGRISADCMNPQTKSRYASYAQLDRYLRPIYTKHNLSLSFDTGDGPEGAVTVLCYVAHADGHSRTYKATIDASGAGAKGGAVMTKTHAAGSAMSYGMRYLLKMIFNVAIGEDDDDGNKAGEVEYITEKNIETLRKFMEETHANEAAFVSYLKIDCLENLPKRDFNKALNALKDRKQRMNKDAS